MEAIRLHPALANYNHPALGHDNTLCKQTNYFYASGLAAPGPVGIISPASSKTR